MFECCGLCHCVIGWQTAGPWRWRHYCPLKHHKPLTQQCSITSLAILLGKPQIWHSIVFLWCRVTFIISTDRLLLEVCVMQQHCQLSHHIVLVTNELVWGIGRMIQTANNKVLMENPIPVPQCPIQIQDRVTWDWTQVSVVRNSRSFIKLHNRLTRALFNVLKMVPQACFNLMYL